jgi:hypothetical protein
MKTLKEQLTGKCRHFNGQLSQGLSDTKITCKAGVVFYDLCKVKELGLTGSALRHPCGGRKAGSKNEGEIVQECTKYSPLTEEEIQAEIEEWEHSKKCFEQGISSCCEAPIDESRVIREGHHEGHGPRYCSKCKRLVYMV